jgi:hypothetical protein
MARNDSRRDFVARTVRNVLDEAGLKWSDIAPLLSKPAGMTDPAGQELSVKLPLRISAADEANLLGLLQYGDLFLELSDGYLDRSKVARQALRFGIEWMYRQVAYWERGGT